MHPLCVSPRNIAEFIWAVNLLRKHRAQMPLSLAFMFGGLVLCAHCAAFCLVCGAPAAASPDRTASGLPFQKILQLRSLPRCLFGSRVVLVRALRSLVVVLHNAIIGEGHCVCMRCVALRWPVQFVLIRGVVPVMKSEQRSWKAHRTCGYGGSLINPS